MSRRKLLRELWETYRVVIPRDASRTQLVETRRAFYAGAASMFDLVTNMTEGPEPQEADLQKMDDIHKELRDYVDEVKRETGVDIKIGSA